MTESAFGHVLTYPGLRAPEVFTREGLGWVPWIQPIPEDELTEEHLVALVDKNRAKMPYFRLLVRDPEALRARTATDNDIFYNTDSGLPRADRELSAVGASRSNGCIFCASVHSRFAVQQSGRAEDVDRVLADGVDSAQDARWEAILEASVALTDTPVALSQAHLDALRAAGLDDLEIADTLHGAAFFNWANRLMLSLGEPELPAAR
ncbi:alkylhydroperoxidase domain protein [Mycetocola tolaasinivorans]|uniref:Alkylhydroperoxidase domain protein n=1 Tax=Mycetocola tolaasinivorans TaxID=76635 RepID=A0A3L7A6E7_9MICO|nr:alkylhydroperoxidase domain protein [Mycetocola tolaasinivorans]RLP75645.1 alkylhydroperoxidase domain protein [Mycetocola tolaasinivorans]